MSNYIMKIYRTKDTKQLLDMLGECQAPVYMLTNDGKEVVLKKNGDVMSMLGVYWQDDNCQEIELKFTAKEDAQRAFDYSFGL